ncbi:cytochrome P450 [Abortiporus biennis]|nr:cytochrome P450 [Abortiporus biennis]
MGDISIGTILLSLTVLYLGYRYVIHLKANPRGLPYPPGPRRWPIIGSLLDFPKEKPYIILRDMSKKYDSDVLYFDLLGTPVVILSSPKAINDLLEKRSGIYSSRPSIPMVDMMGVENILSIMPYNETWKHHRKTFHRYFSAVAVEQYKPQHLYEVRSLLKNIYQSSDPVHQSIRFSIASTIFNITYGIKVTSENDQYVGDIETVLKNFSLAVTFGTFLVDIFPFLKLVPEWFPGAEFKKFARRSKELLWQTRDRPFEFVKKAMKSGTAKPCVAVRMLEDLPNGPEREVEEDEAKSCAVVAYAGGADTNSVTLEIFILAMILFPEVQDKAKEELDRVVGPNRLPNFEDRPYLPYMEAVVKELLRWEMVAPMSLAHATTTSDEYNGYYIPQGAIVMPNTWAILHDPEIFPEPEKFKPERYLTEDGKLRTDLPIDPSHIAFGYGRRMCPGRFFAHNTLFINISSVIHIFDIQKSKDENGNLIPVHVNMRDGLVAPTVGK